MTRFTGTLAVEGFDGADTGDIDGRTPDGGGDATKAVGAWATHPLFGGGLLGIAGNVGVNTVDYASYNLTAIPALPAAYGSRLRQTLPSSDSATPPTGQYLEPWTYYAYAEGPGVAHGPWTGNVSDLVGGLTIGGVIQIHALTLGTNGQPVFVDLEMAAGDPANGDIAHILFRSHASDLAGSTPHNFDLDVDWENTVPPTTFESPISPGTYVIPASSARLHVGAGTSAVAVTTNVTPTDPTPPGSGWANLTGSDHSSQVVGTTNTSTGVTVALHLDAQSGRFEWTFSELATDDGGFELVDPGDGGDEFVLFEVAVCKDDSARRMYQLEGTFQHPIGGIPTLSLELWEYHTTPSTGSKKLANTFGPIFWAHDRAPDIQLDIDADKVLHAYLGDGTTDDEIFTFAIGVDTPPGGGTVQDYAGLGSPGVSGLDFNFAFSALPVSWELAQYAVCVPDSCEGGPDNPYPWDPPPLDPNADARLWVMTRGGWRVVAAPDPLLGTSGLSPMARGSRRVPTALAVWARGQWRTVPGPESDQSPPPNTPFPPFFDPCDLTPGIPVGDVEPIPLTGRFFGMSQTPVSALGPLLTGTMIADGPWTPGMLATAAANGAVVIGSQGDYAQYRVLNPDTGRMEYSRDALIDLTLGKLVPILATLQARTLDGTYFGHNVADDFDGSRLWPPSGIPHSDFPVILAALRASCPDIRFGLRARYTELEEDFGFDFYLSQFVPWRGVSAFAFGASEYAGIAAGWGKLICLNLNYMSGDGSSGIKYNDGTQLAAAGRAWECTAAEVASYLPDMFAGAASVDPDVPLLAGSAGYQYSPPFLGRTGMLDAMATARNALAGYPAP